MRRRQIALCIVLLITLVAAGIGGTIDWKGVTWTINDGPDGNVVTNADGSLTLTTDGDGDIEIYVTTLPGFDQMSNQ